MHNEMKIGEIVNKHGKATMKKYVINRPKYTI